VLSATPSSTAGLSVTIDYFAFSRTLHKLHHSTRVCLFLKHVLFFFFNSVSFILIILGFIHFVGYADEFLFTAEYTLLYGWTIIYSFRS
jgi:hypothetical protein